MKGLAFEVDCYRCGGDLEPLTTTRASSSWRSMVLRCPNGHEWQVTVELLQVPTVSAAKKREYRSKVSA